MYGRTVRLFLPYFCRTPYIIFTYFLRVFRGITKPLQNEWFWSAFCIVNVWRQKGCSEEEGFVPSRPMDRPPRVAKLQLFVCYKNDVRVRQKYGILRYGKLPYCTVYGRTSKSEVRRTLVQLPKLLFVTYSQEFAPVGGGDISFAAILFMIPPPLQLIYLDLPLNKTKHIHVFVNMEALPPPPPPPPPPPLPKAAFTPRANLWKSMNYTSQF